MTAYYNEIDHDAAQWLRTLIAAGAIAPGDVDERDIRDVRAGDVAGYDQCHFFAGIGGWSAALRLAGWADNRPVWTGSCPCQPFSQAGKRKGFADERHLWPEWFRLIRECAPATIFGEQVANAAKWLSLVRADLERTGFAFASRKLRASDFGAPHRRARLWFVAANADREAGWLQSGRGIGARRQDTAVAGTHGAPQYVADAAGLGWGSGRPGRLTGVDKGLRDTAGALANANGFAPVGPAIAWPERDPWGSEPAVGRVVDGLSHKLAEPALRALGNAIVPQVAAEFIIAADEAMNTAENMTRTAIANDRKSA